MKPTCPYCTGRCELVSGSVLYTGRGRGRMYWACLPCKAWVGCHPGTHRPLGKPARKGLRDLRRTVHERYLDRLWKEGHMTRKQAYRWLAAQMETEEVHVGEFEENECYKAIRIIGEHLERLWAESPVRSPSTTS